MVFWVAYLLRKILSKVSQSGIEFAGKPIYHDDVAPLRVCGKSLQTTSSCSPALNPSIAKKKIVNGHQLASSHLDQTWETSSQRLEVSSATEVLSSRVIWLSRQVVDSVGWVVDLHLRLP